MVGTEGCEEANRGEDEGVLEYWSQERREDQGGHKSMTKGEGWKSGRDSLWGDGHVVPRRIKAQRKYVSAPLDFQRT